MGFWGIEVKPGKPYPYRSDNVRGTLHITQATLGLGSSKERRIVQCSVGHKKSIFLCALLPNKNESCPLNLEFDEDNLVAFSVIGPQSVHLSGYFVAYEEEFVRDDYESDSLGEDIAETETDSSEYNTNDDYGEDDEESEDGFFVRDDNDYDMHQTSNVPKSGVVIEEIVDDDKPNRDDQIKHSKKKKPSSGSLEDTNSQHKIFVRRDASITVMESEDEDGFSISITQKSESDQKLCVDAQQTNGKTTEKPKKIAKDSDSASNSKRKVENVDEDGEPDSQNKKKKKKKKQHLEEQVKEHADQKQPEENEVVKMDELDHKSSNEKTADVEMDTTPIESRPVDKKKKNKNKTDQEKGVTSSEQPSRSTLQSEQQQIEAKASKTRTFPNGLVVEEVAMGKPDGKRASPGKQVSVRYIGKLKNGKIFDSNVRGPPFKFRLGLGQVIAGWDVGVDGMRVGDKRRLTIPPSMGYGSKGAGGKIPPNSWLVFDVELIDVR